MERRWSEHARSSRRSRPRGRGRPTRSTSTLWCRSTQGDSRAARVDATVGRRAAEPADRPPVAAGFDLGDGARLRRRTPATLRRPRAVPVLGGVRRADRLLLRAAARHRPRACSPTPSGPWPSCTPHCSAASTSSTRSTSASPRSGSTTRSRPTRSSPRCSAGRRRARGTGTRASARGDASGCRRSSASTATGSTRSPRS